MILVVVLLVGVCAGVPLGQWMQRRYDTDTATYRDALRPVGGDRRQGEEWGRCHS
jgi:hypothetical protein